MTYPDSDDVDVLCLEQGVDLAQGGDWEAVLLLLHLQSLQRHNLICSVSLTVIQCVSSLHQCHIYTMFPIYSISFIVGISKWADKTAAEAWFSPHSTVSSKSLKPLTTTVVMSRAYICSTVLSLLLKLPRKPVSGKSLTRYTSNYPPVTLQVSHNPTAEYSPVHTPDFLSLALYTTP